MLLFLVICKNKTHKIFIKILLVFLLQMHNTTLYIFKTSKLAFYKLRFLKKRKENARCRLKCNVMENSQSGKKKLLKISIRFNIPKEFTNLAIGNI